MSRLLSEKDGYTITVRLCLEPGRLPTETSRYSTDTHTVLTGQCPLPSMEDLDLPTLLAASEPVKVTWDRNEGTKIENIGSTASTFDNISAMLQKLCPAAAESLSTCVLESGSTGSKSLTGDAFLASVCNVRLTQQEWSRASAARSKHEQEPEQPVEMDVESLAKQWEKQLECQREFIVQQQAYSTTMRDQEAVSTIEVRETKHLDELLQQMILLQDVLSETIERVRVEQKERLLIHVPPPQIISRTAMTQCEDCHISEEVCAMLVKLRALSEGDMNAMPRHCCKGKEKISQPHVHGRLNGMPVVISLVEAPRTKPVKRKLSTCCMKKSRSKTSEPYYRRVKPNYVTKSTETYNAQITRQTETDFESKLTDCKFSQKKPRPSRPKRTLGTQTSTQNLHTSIQSKDLKPQTHNETIATQTMDMVSTPSFSSIAHSNSPCPFSKIDNCTRGLCSRTCSGRSSNGCPHTCPGIHRSDGSGKSDDDAAVDYSQCFGGQLCSHAQCDECFFIRRLHDEQSGPEKLDTVVISTQTIPVEKSGSVIEKNSKSDRNSYSPQVERKASLKEQDTQTSASTVSGTLTSVDENVILHPVNGTKTPDPIIKEVVTETPHKGQQDTLSPPKRIASAINHKEQQSLEHNAQRSSVKEVSLGTELAEKRDQATEKATKVDTIYNVQRPSRVQKRTKSSSSSEILVTAPPVQARLVKKYGMHDIMQIAKVPSCACDVVTNDEVHTEFPYAPSFNSLPLDDDDAAEISARIEKARSGSGVASGAQVYMAAADFRFRHQRDPSRLVKDSEISSSSFSIIDQEKLREHKRMLYKYLLNELQKYNTKFYAQKNIPVVVKKPTKTTEFNFGDKSFRNNYSCVTPTIKNVQKSSIGNKLQSVAECGAAPSPKSTERNILNINIDSLEAFSSSSNCNTNSYSNTSKQSSNLIYPSKISSRNTSMQSSSSNTTKQSSNMINSSKQFSNVQTVTYRSAQISTHSTRRTHMRLCRKSVSDTSLGIQKQKISATAEREKENRNNSCKMLWALSRAPHLEKPSEIWDILPPGKNKHNGCK